MNSIAFKQSIELLDELRLLLKAKHNVSIPELDKLKNIIQDENYQNSNIDRILYFSYRRIQEIGIYDEDVDAIFESLFFMLKTNH